MIGENKIVIAAAGSGKTTYLVEEAVKIKGERVLITTYTESNEAEIRQKFFELVGHVPANVVIMTWFSFLITHGVKPFQGSLFEFPVSGMVLVSAQSGLKFKTRQGQPVFWTENEIDKHYFDPVRRVYSDKLPKLVIRCNEKSGGAVMDRISRIFPHVLVDSRAMGASEFAWDEDGLARFLANPRQTIPGTTMVFVGIRDEAEIANLIAFLMQFE